MADPGDDPSSSFSESSSPNSSSPSSRSVSESNNTDLTCGSEGDFRALADEGIYGWILSLIEEGKVARFVDRLQGIYELDWQIVASKYWFEWRESRRDFKSKSVKNVKFSHRTASNTLRASLLNAYKDKGAVEFPERKVLDSRNKTVKRCFMLPSPVMHKLSRYQNEITTNTPATASDIAKSPHVFLTPQQDTQHEEGVASVAFPFPSSITSMDPNALNVDDEESESLIRYMVDQQMADLPDLSSNNDLLRTSASSDHHDWTMSNDAASSGYDSSLEENLVKEIDPSEGPYQGGNTAFIFLEDSIHSRCYDSASRSTCKVVFSVPQHGPLSAREVTATVKNCFTIKVSVPHCPARPSGGQLACGKLTAQVMVNTLEGRYIGETRYTYITNLMAQFEHCVKALDDEDMELEFTSSTEEQHVALNYRQSDLTGCHVFNFASLRVLMFVAVKEKACNLLSTFFNSPATLPVLQHYKQKLLSFLEHVRRSEKPSSVSVLDMCEKMLQEITSNCKSTEQKEQMPLLRGIEANESGKEKEKYEKGYDSGSELETSLEIEALGQEGRETEALAPQMRGQKFDMDKHSLDNEHKNVTGERDQGKDTSVHLTCSLNLEDSRDQNEKRQDSNVPSNKAKIFVLRKPCSPVPISRSRVSFPDPRTDVFVELQVRKSQRALEDAEKASEHVTERRQLVTEHVPLQKHHVIVDVRHSGTEQSAKDWESKFVKRVSGKLGYWFRFYKPNCELSLVFTLCDKAQLATKPETKPRTTTFKALDHVTVVVETVNWKGTFSKEAKTEKESDKHELALTNEVPLVSLSRSQVKLCAIMNELHQFCDNGHWAEFEKACTNLERQSCNVDIKVVILLEKAIAFLYQQNLEKAELTALEALENASRAENRQLLAGRAYYYLAHVYRRERKLGEAVRCIDLSKQNLHLMDVCLDQSFLAYEEGNVMKEFISGCANLSKKLVLQAKQCFERCLDLCKRLDGSDASVIPTTHSFALTKIAMLLLDCGSTSGRERCVSVSHIQEAKRFLDLLQRCGLDEITERRKIQFHLACSDLQYRMRDYQGALHDAEGALKKAKELGFSLEITPASNRVSHISQLLASGGCFKYSFPQL